MTDWLPVYIVAAVAGAFCVVIAVKGLPFIQPGELGLQFLFGMYYRTLMP